MDYFDYFSDWAVGGNGRIQDDFLKKGYSGGNEFVASGVLLRSPYVLHFSETILPVNVLRVLSPYP
ncbi:hypothetical protein [Citrobacter youngae]|uniref:hypothetical protein n=1 Tax=Citrobacter youngae TaxID=133448 RepID=UPI0012EA1164|nr:hypothetical protein [Citrobacter youngae]